MAERWVGSWIAVGVCAWQGLLFGCAPEHPPFVDEDVPMTRGGGLPGTQPGSPDEPSSSGGGKGSGSGSGGPNGSGSFDPRQVYFSGILWCGGCMAAAPKPYVASSVENPDEFVFGFWGEWRGRLWGSKLVYARGKDIVQFVADDDVGQTTPPDANDEVVAELECGDLEPGFFLTTPKRLLYTCGNVVNVYYEDGKKIYDGDYAIIDIVTDDLALIAGRDLPDTEAQYGVLRLSTGEASPIEAFPPKIDGFWATRAAGAGFRMVIQPKFDSPRELWNVKADGSADKLGTYPDFPDGVQLAGALAADDTYFTAEEVDGESRILSATIGHSNYLVAHAFDDPNRSASGFFTGP